MMYNIIYSCWDTCSRLCKNSVLIVLVYMILETVDTWYINNLFRQIIPVTVNSITVESFSNIMIESLF